MAGTERERGSARTGSKRGKPGGREPAAPKAALGQGERQARARAGAAAAGAALAAPAAERRNGAARRRAAAAGVDRVEEPVAAGGHAMIDLDFLRGLIDAVDASGIDSIEIARAGTRIRISKTPPPAPMIAGSAAAPLAGRAAEPTSVSAAGAAAAPMGNAAAEGREPEAVPHTELVDVKSPMVGTFYRAPAPEAPPYVEVGSHVTQGQTLCILEAMKLMNELECEIDGVVREVLVENTEPVEFGQVLFRIEPTKR